MTISDMPYDEFVASLAAQRQPKPRPPAEVWTRIPKRVLLRGKRSKTAHLRRGNVSGHEFMAADPCVYCGGPSSQWDHIEPLFRSGTHSGDNMARACWNCNKAKNIQKLVVFLARRRQHLLARGTRDERQIDENTDLRSASAARPSIPPRRQE